MLNRKRKSWYTKYDSRIVLSISSYIKNKYKNYFGKMNSKLMTYFYHHLFKTRAWIAKGKANLASQRLPINEITKCI